METKVLVTYASKYGATAEIAEKIAEVLTRAGLKTDILPVKDVTTLNPYDAVILGSALYVGCWRKEARKFIKRYEQKLAARDLWLFLSGPTGQDDGTDISDAYHLSKKMAARLEHTAPRDIRVFRGAIDTDKLSSLEEWMVGRVKAPVGDFREWEAITDWAETIANSVTQRAAQTA